MQIEFSKKTYLCTQVKRFLAISFLAIYILTATECNQLLKFPILIEHFSEHKEANNEISFFDFLYMHYQGHDFNDNDQNQDMKLPFKSHSDFASIDMQFVTVHTETISLHIIGKINESEILRKRLNFKSSYLSEIWQPPKACS